MAMESNGPGEFSRVLRVHHNILGTMERPRFVIGTGRDEEASRDDMTEEQRRPGPKMGLTGGPGRFWPDRRRASLPSPGMRALRSLARAKIFSANCTGYGVTDP